MYLFALHLDAQEPHSLSSLKANVCIFLYISVRVILFHRRSKLLSSGGRWLGMRQNDFLQVGRCSDLINVLQFLILIEIFGNSTIFSAFQYNFLKFSRQLELQG